ncbi:MAG: class I tRNA ligase family protein [Candidatus Moranbacteria bacterium]|nr:class I tRNA ligase family protein [Candidatus Moranbacteria bacterium]
MDKYNPKSIESKWQKAWAESGIYQDYSKKKKFYALDMFPYPSGAGLHVGHPKGYIATDVVARFKILQGYSVLHPMGWDAFGLPAENYAIKNKIHPKAAVEKNIATFKGQLKKFGFTYDWDREINTTDPQYYRWTQWIFLKMFEKGLAYESEEPVNWCPKCKTVLANEDLEKGLCERCGSRIVQRKLRQWVLKMTDYADRLLYDLDNKDLNWEELIKEQQKNWIGRSEGAIIKFKVKSEKLKVKEEFFIETYTTRLDTIYGCTYCVVAPEHPLVASLLDIKNEKLKIKNIEEVRKYVINSQNKTELERTELQKEKTGVELKGIKIINPFNDEEIPLFAADYVLGFYGTGAVMAVPAHDERDWEFAKKYDLEIKQSIAPYLKDNPQEDKKTEKREVATAIVKNPKNNTYLCLNWKTTAWKSFPTGGIDNGEDAVKSAMREIEEEAGYKNLKFIKQIGDSIYAEFYRPHKGSNVFAHFKYFLFELIDEKKAEVEEKEKKQHEAVWVTEKDIISFINVWNQKIIWKKYTEGDFAYCEDGIMINSGIYNGLKSQEAREKMTQWLEKEKIGQKKINYKMRDWVFSRQRYWGEPIPLVFCEHCAVKIKNQKSKIKNNEFSKGELMNPGWFAISEQELPLKLPEVESYEATDTGESPLAKIKDWVNTICPKCGGPAKRETNTMPQWAGSCWYYLRYIDPKNSQALVDKKKEKEWMPVDLYVGGAEHATRHLLYARFWHKFLYDIGVVSTTEPFKKLVHVGLINAEDGRKMSKRWNNVVNPDDIIAEFGADALRLYEMFMGPFVQNISWSTKGVVGTKRFLEKVYNLRIKANGGRIDANKKIESLLHKTIKKVGEDIENFRFNTAVSQLMILVNEMEREKEIPITNYQLLITILSPFAPHISDELWNQLGNKESIFKQKWPEYDKNLIKDEEFDLVVQINGKLRDTLKAAMDISETEAKELALQSEKIKNYIAGKEIKKIIFVKNRLINIVV